MVHLIDKDALVAEIESLLDKGKYHEEYDCAYRDGNNGALYALKDKLDTIEVKEVQEEPKDKCKCCNNVKGCITCVDGSEWAHYEYVDNNNSITQADSYVKAHEDICDRKEPVSIWHDASEVPEDKNWVLLTHRDGWYHVGRLYEGQHGNLVISDGVSAFKLCEFKKWANIDDILKL